MSIMIQTGFDGSCPHNRKNVRRDRQGRFILFPGLRRGPGLGEEVPGKGSRLSTRIVNTDKAERSVDLVVDWDTPQRVEHHDLGYIRHERAADWTMVPGRRNGTRVEYCLKIAPGLTHMGLYPEYNVEQVVALVGELKTRGVRVEIAGRSRERRPIWLIRFKSSNPKARPFLIQTRDHAYETAGSYCSEGIARFLASNDPIAQYLLSKFSVYILPMTNPDGVYNGMSQRTWERGPRMDNVFDINDSALSTVRRVVDRVKPKVYLTIHNWTAKFTDGMLYGHHESLATLIRRFMPDDVAHYKHWDVRSLSYVAMKSMKLVNLTEYIKRGDNTVGLDEVGKALHVLSGRISHWVIYCEETYGAVGLAMEFPWFGLNTCDMREKGKRAFIATALAVIETQKL